MRRADKICIRNDGMMYACEESSIVCEHIMYMYIFIGYLDAQPIYVIGQRAIVSA